MQFQNIINHLFTYQFTPDVFTAMDRNGDGKCSSDEFASQWMQFGGFSALPGFLAVPSQCSFDFTLSLKLKSSQMAFGKSQIKLQFGLFMN